MGYRQSQEVQDDLDTADKYSIHIAGIMRLYFHILVRVSVIDGEELEERRR